MTKEDFWIHKIKAFLSTSPDISLFSDDGEKVIEFINAAFENQTKDVDINFIKDSKSIAGGFDIPPFIKRLSTNSFTENPIFKHPLSGEEIKLDFNLADIDEAEIKKIIKNSITEIREEVKKIRDENSNRLSEEEYHKRFFFALWRKLPDVIRQKESATTGVKIGRYWDWLPADPHIPTHSVWEHSSIASAIAGANENPALLIFTIASPQQFISTARRTQDSWMGSFLYSFLMWEAIKSIADKIGPDCFLFPDLRRQPLVDKWLETEMKISDLSEYEEGAFQIANFPNIMTAIVPFSDAEKIAKDAHKAMQEKWRKIVNVIKDKTDGAIQDKLGINPTSWNNAWERQTKEFLAQGVYWVACPWQDGEKDIFKVYENLFPKDAKLHNQNSKQKNPVESLKELLKFTEKQGFTINSGMTYQCVSSLASRALNTRKNLRDFYNQKEIGDRCSLCGIREALHPEKAELERVFQNFSVKTKRENDKFVPIRLLRRFWNELSDISYKKSGEQIKFQGRIKPGDRLCAVCLVKRMALDFYFNKNHDNGFSFDRHLFPSTSSIATAPFKARMIDSFENCPDKKKLLDTYISQTLDFLEKLKLDYESSAVPELEKKLNDIRDKNYQDLVEKFLRLDGQWLFEDSFKGAEVEEKINFISGRNSSTRTHLEDLRKKAINSLKNFLKALNFKPSKYYAVVSMDGDNIGKWLGGKKSPTLGSLLHPEIAEQLSENSDFDKILKMKRPLGAISHLSLSIALKNFALEVAPKVIENSGYYGKLIYAGGDDLLAFMPTDRLLELISELNTLFQGKNTSGTYKKDLGNPQEEREYLVAGNKQDEEDHLTASIGVAIVHNSYPLPQAIEEAFSQAMKENAKETLERNAVAIHLNKRAGTPLKVGFRWNDIHSDNQKGIAESLQKIIEYFRNDDVSSRFGYAMKNWEIGLEGKWENDNDPVKVAWWHNAQKQTLKLLVRKYAKKNKVEEIQNELSNLLSSIYESYKKIEDKSAIDTGWDTLTKLLILARFLAKGDSEE